MSGPVTDAQLMARVGKGDHDAFTTVMTAHEDRVFAVCLRVLGNREMALDATQETFLTVFRKAAQFKGEAAAGTWIYRIAVNTCYDLIRKSRRRRADPLPESYDLADPIAQERVESAGLSGEIERALAGLPPEFRSAIVLADIEGMALPDVALALGAPLGTVKSRLFRGRRLLAQRLGNQSAT